MFEEEFIRKDFISSADGRADWYLVRKGDPAKPLIVNLHGHGSHADQILRRKDVVEIKTTFLVEQNFSVLAPNYRDNSWMSEAAQQDLVQVLQREKEFLKWNRLIMISGSMGGTASMIFAMRHPELTDAVGVMGGATDLHAYVSWLSQQKDPPVLAQIRDAIREAFPSAEARERNCVLLHAERLKNLPFVFYHGEADQIIPVLQARALAEKMKDSPRFVYREIPGGDHDSPLAYYREILQTLLKMICDPPAESL